MGINQLVDAYKGNPAPLQARVQQAQKNQPPGAIPPDLEEAIALQKIAELRNSAQSQQAMQAGGAQPSIVEKMRQMLGAEQRQQAQPPEMPQGMPQGQLVMAARGGSIDQLMSNLGRHYDKGGIVTPQNLSFTPSNSTAGRDYERELLERDEEVMAKDLKAKYLAEVGQKDLSVYDEMAAELKAQRERSKGPEQGYGKLMEYLGQIAQSGGRDWMESGSKGAAGLNALQKARQERQDALAEKIIDIGAKKKEAEYGEKLGLFNLTKAEKDKIIKEKTDVAGKLGLSEDEEKKLIQQSLEKELDRKSNIRQAQISAQDRDNLMSRARALMAADPTKKMTLEQAMQRAAEIGAAGQMESAEVKKLSGFTAAKKEIDANPKYISMLFDKKNKPENAQLRAEYAAEINEAKRRYGITDQGLNALPAAATPIPAGAKPSDLNVGTVYQTARGPAKWNGKTFDPVQ